MKKSHVFIVTLLVANTCLSSGCRQPGERADEPKAARAQKPVALAPAVAPARPEKPAPVFPDGIVSISKIQGVSLDLRYRSPDNFVGEDLYGEYSGDYLHEDAARKLEKAAQLLSEERPGWKLRVLDALRPREIQRRLFEKVKGTPQVRYVADPRDGSGHNYGMSVDVTLEDEHGNEIDMGTSFDDFTPLSQPRHERMYLANGKLTREQYENRLLLRRVMRQAGFGSLLQEWWHFNARGIKTIKARYKVIEEVF